MNVILLSFVLLNVI
jgi:hypothetical protein